MISSYVKRNGEDDYHKVGETISAHTLYPNKMKDDCSVIMAKILKDYLHTYVYKIREEYRYDMFSNDAYN